MLEPHTMCGARMGRRIITYLALIFVVSAALTSAALIIRNVFEVSIEGIVNVPPTGAVMDIELNVDEKEGERVINLGVFNIPAGSIIVRPNLTRREGSFAIVLGGELTLKSDKHVYRILMPCLMSVGKPCYRIMMLIPGYDTPLNVEEGVYNATLTLRWTAEGSGKFRLKLTLEYGGNAPEPSIEVIGVKPEATDDWTVTPNSTRTYSMLVKTFSQTSTLAWIWIFDPNNLSAGRLTLKLIDSDSGDVVAEESVRAFRDGFYWSVLVEVRTPGEGNYEIACFLEGGAVLSARIIKTK